MQKPLAALGFCAALIWGHGAQAAITFVAAGAYASNSSTSVTLAKPTGTASGDAEVMCVSVITTVATGTITTPAAWTVAQSTGAANDGTGAFVNTYLFYKVAGGAEPSTYTVSYNTGGTIAAMDGVIVDYTGTAAASPVNSSAAVLGGNTAANVVPGLTETFVAGEWYVGCSVSRDNTLPAASPAMTTRVSNTGFLESYFVGDLIPLSAPGAETYTYAGSDNGRTAWGVSLKSLSGGGGPVTHWLPLMGVGK